MKKILLLLLLLNTTGAFAQKPRKGSKVEAKKEEVPVVAGIPLSWGGRALLASEKMTAVLFGSLLQKALSVTVGDGVVAGFDFTYAERGLYEDSVGNPLLVTDYMSEFCKGDTLSKNIKLLLPGRAKAGDTVYIAGVRVQLPGGGKPVLGRPARIILTP